MAPEPDRQRGPADPFGPLTEGATAVHEMFLAYEKAGFSATQALYLTGVVLSTALRNISGPPNPGPGP